MVDRGKHLDGSLEGLVGAAPGTGSFLHHRWLSGWDVEVHLTKAESGTVVAPELGCVVDDHSCGIEPGVHFFGVSPMQLRTLRVDCDEGSNVRL